MEKSKKEAEPAKDVSVRNVEFPALFDMASPIEPSEKKHSVIPKMLQNVKPRRIVGESFTLWAILTALLVLLASEFEVGGMAVVNLIPNWLFH